MPDLSLDPDSAALTIINGRAESRVHQQAGRSFTCMYRLQLHF